MTASRFPRRLRRLARWVKDRFRPRKDLVLPFVFGVGFLVPLALCLPASARIEADLSRHLVAIQANFQGDKILLFGSVAERGEERGDVVVVVQGPDTNFKLHRKSEVGGIWINTAYMIFEDVPSFYAIASTAPLDQITSERTRVLNRLGVDYIGFELPAEKSSGPVAEQWKNALVNALQDMNNYQMKQRSIRFLGEQLFRVEFELPSNVPTGNYDVGVYQLQDGQVVSALTTPLSVSKMGVEAAIYDFAQYQTALYGTVAVLVALMAGWAGGLLFRS